jgi:TRAP-type C4-dicarboxylate transport system permease small subunit
MVVGNSLLINAVRSELDIATNLFLSLAGLFLCILWGIMTWDGWNWFYKSMADAKKLPVDPLLNPFSSMPNLADRHSDTIFNCTMAMIVIFGRLCGGFARPPQNQDFDFELASRLEAVAQHANEKKANCNHVAIMF